MQTYTTTQYKSIGRNEKMPYIDLLIPNTLKNIPLKLRALINAYKLSDRKFAESIDTAPEQVNRWLKGVVSPSIRTLEKIKSVYPEFNYEGNSNSIEINTYNGVSMPLNDVQLLNVPLVPEFAYAGYMSGFASDSYLGGLPTIPFIVEKQYKGNYIAFQVRGDSMNDGTIDSYASGDVILCRNIDPSYWVNKLHINKWDFVIVHKTDGILVKKITAHNTDNGAITAHSLNPFYSDIELNLKDVSQLLNVVKIERKK